jgi:hypothetical protein
MKTKRYFRVIDPETTRIKGWCDEESQAHIREKYPKYYFREIGKAQFDDEIEEMSRTLWLEGKPV